jgi:3-oxoadipate enol-lactonase
LIIAGLLDAATPLEMHEFLPDQISTAEMITMEAAHLSNIEQPAAYTDAVLHFLAPVK